MTPESDAPPDLLTGRATSPLRPPAPVAPAGSGRRRAWTQIWRLRAYLRPEAPRWALIIVATLIGTATTLVTPLLLRAIIDGPLARGDQRGVLWLGAAALVVGILEAAMWFLRRIQVGIAALNTETAIRQDLYARMQRLGMRFHGQWPGGQLLSRVMNDLSLLRRFLGFGGIFLVVNTLQVLVVLGMLLALYWPLGVVVAASAIPYIWVVYLNEKKFVVIARDIQDQTGDVASAVEELAHGVRVIKSFGRQDYVYDRFDQRSVRLKDRWIDRTNLSAGFWTLLEIIPNLTLILVLGIGAWAVSQGMSLGTLIAFVTLMPNIAWPMATLGFLLSMAQESMTAADRIVEVFDAEPELIDGDKELVNARGHVRFESVSFRFPDADEDVLHEVSFEILPGETLAVVGATGSGKSTLTSLVPRLRDVTAGRITLDGVDIRELTLANLRSLVATAFEEPTLFSMSVRENLTLGRPEATEAEIHQALEIAQASFVEDLPWGLDTRIGEQGMSLSGGQRQRLALARAVLTRPAVLVLDDTLSALDVHTEKLVEEALSSVLTSVTGIIVAHRASTVLLADKVALVQNGTVTHVGTHAELLATVPAYRYLLAADDELDPDHERGGPGPGEHPGDDREWSRRLADRMAHEDLSPPDRARNELEEHA